MEWNGMEWKFLETVKLYEFSDGEQVKRAKVDSVKEVCGSVGLRRKNPMGGWWNDAIKANMKRKEAI